MVLLFRTSPTLTAPIAKFNATILDTVSPIDITISDARVDNVVQSSVSETFDFTSVDVKKHGRDR